MLDLSSFKRQNVSFSNFQWQILSRVKQISTFYKVGSFRVTNWRTCCIFEFSKFQCKKYWNFYLGNAVLYKWGKGINFGQGLSEKNGGIFSLKTFQKICWIYQPLNFKNWCIYIIFIGSNLAFYSLLFENLNKFESLFFILKITFTLDSNQIFWRKKYYSFLILRNFLPPKMFLFYFSPINW